MKTSKIVITNDNDSQALKKPFGPLLFVKDNVNQTLLKPSYLRSEYCLKISSQFDDSLKLIAYLTRNCGSRASIGEGTFRISLVNLDWSESLIGTFNGILDNGKLTLELSESTLGVELIGEYIFLIEVLAKRFRKNYRAIAYSNHIGIFDYALRIKNKVNFLDITLS